MSSPNTSFEPGSPDPSGARLKWSAFVPVGANKLANDSSAIPAPPDMTAPVRAAEAPARAEAGGAADVAPAAGQPEASALPSAPSPAGDVPPEPSVAAETARAESTPGGADVPALRAVDAPFDEIRPERFGRAGAERPFRDFSAGAEPRFETFRAAPASRSAYGWGRRVRRAGLHALLLASAAAFGWICGELGLPRTADSAMRGSLAPVSAATPAQPVPAPAPVADSPALRDDMQGLKDDFARAQQNLAAKLDQLIGRVERVERASQAPAAKLDQIASRLAQLEQNTGSVSAPVAQTAPAGPTASAAPNASVAPNVSAAPATSGVGDSKARALSGWSVREVFDGIAVVDGPYGTMEVVAGDSIPGVGRVDAIRRRGGTWILVTSRGTITSDHR